MMPTVYLCDRAKCEESADRYNKKKIKGITRHAMFKTKQRVSDGN